jgi:hypothetical protein
MRQLKFFIGSKLQRLRRRERWIFRFELIPVCMGRRAGRPGKEPSGHTVYQAFSRRSGCVPAEPYPPLKQNDCAADDRYLKP